MRKLYYYIFILVSGSFVFPAEAECSTLLLPPDYYKATIINGDTIPLVRLPEVFIFKPPVFRNKRDEQRYYKLIRDVKRTLPYAKLVYGTLIETYEYLETLPTDKLKEQHLKKMEKDLFKEYKPVLSKLSLSQGKLLLKLINRECNQSSFNLLKAYLGGFRAGFWNFFATMFGASLKTEYDPKGKDAELEKIVILVERGLI